MEEIATKLEQALVHAVELKQFLANLRVTSYSDVQAFADEQNNSENHFPVYSETTECDTDKEWGAYKLGRIPEFCYTDASSTTTSVSAYGQSGKEAAELNAHTYKDCLPYAYPHSTYLPQFLCILR